MADNQKNNLPSLAQVATTWGPFALLLSAALLVPEAQTDVTLMRAKYTIWVSILFAIPAYALYVSGVEYRRDAAGYQFWRLLWTFAFAAYAMHFYYVFFVLYRVSFSAVIEQQTALVALPNFLFTVWWAVDVAGLWWLSQQDGWVRVQRVCFQFFSFGVFVTAFVFLRPGLPFHLGMLLIIVVVSSLLIRFLKEPPATPAV